ncbi:helix-turn-helix domain-containing protein [Oscillibacter sp.]|uniref:helix-turn-helix domain-containing protein n=1 Tax=Oscillibacter sp. TaxID=1945593 RepID=UPI0028A09414|nr:helix-turn-helix domain-containing protein [Oscillibacter sp.]
MIERGVLINCKRDAYKHLFRQYPDVIDVYTLQKMLGISRHHAYTLITSGQIKGRKVGKSYKIPKVYVIDFLLQNDDADTLVQKENF